MFFLGHGVEMAGDRLGYNWAPIGNDTWGIMLVWPVTLLVVSLYKLYMLCVCTAGSPDTPFNRTITYGCLSKLLSWAKSEYSSMKYMKSHDDTSSGVMQQGETASSVGTSTNLSQLVHAVIRNIDTYGAGGSCPASQRQLKPNLPQFCHLNRKVCRTLTPGTSYCCLTAECLYVSQSTYMLWPVWQYTVT